MSFTVEIVEGSEIGRDVPLEGTIEIGREPAPGGLALDDGQVSRRHARLTVTGSDVTVEDIGSRNGTYVNGQVIHGPRVLAPGDQVRLGLTVLELRSAQETAVSPAAARPRPQVTVLSPRDLRPVPEAELPKPTPQSSVDVSSFLAEESEPAFVPEAVAKGSSESRSAYDELAALVDSRVKRQANVAAFALIAVSALAVIIYFGAR
jgi:pSer/pThr/pTyr-binding forkhead associated (FHA) protein